MLVMLLISLPLILLIKLQDRGPVFYGHPRVTVAGKRFDCLKFRTMQVAADERLKEILEKDPRARTEWEKNFKLKDDPRVTWIGRFLRKTSLDELLQFINVLKGEMWRVSKRNDTERLSSFYCYFLPLIYIFLISLNIAEAERVDLATSFAYSDHESDLPMLELVGNPVAINCHGKRLEC